MLTENTRTQKEGDSRGAYCCDCRMPVVAARVDPRSLKGRKSREGPGRRKWRSGMAVRAGTEEMEFARVCRGREGGNHHGRYSLPRIKPPLAWSNSFGDASPPPVLPLDYNQLYVKRLGSS